MSTTEAASIQRMRLLVDSVCAIVSTVRYSRPVGGATCGLTVAALQAGSGSGARPVVSMIKCYCSALYRVVDTVYDQVGWDTHWLPFNATKPARSMNTGRRLVSGQAILCFSCIAILFLSIRVRLIA